MINDSARLLCLLKSARAVVQSSRSQRCLPVGVNVYKRSATCTTQRLLRFAWCRPRGACTVYCLWSTHREASRTACAASVAFAATSVYIALPSSTAVRPGRVSRRQPLRQPLGNTETQNVTPLHQNIY